MALLPTMEKWPMAFYKGVACDNSSPTVARDQEICQNHMIMR